MKRRQFITLLGGAAAAPLVLPRAASAQQPMPVVAFLRDGTADSSQHFINPFRKGLADAGFVEGKNVTVEYALTEGVTTRLPEMTAQLVRRPVAVIVTSTIQAAVAAKQATSSIPIVFVIGNDPVAFKLVASIARPGGNVTGISYLTQELGGKRLGLLHELLPGVSDFAVLLNPKNAGVDTLVRDVQEAARTIKARVHFFRASNAAEIDHAFSALVKQRAGGFMTTPDPVFTGERRRIVALAARHKLPALYPIREFVDDGGLMSYGAPLTQVYRQSGVYAGLILKGEQPAELPVVLPTTFEMVANLKTAKALGFTFPPLLLARADEVIE